MCATVYNLYNVYNKNYLFVIFLCSHPLREQRHLFVRSVKRRSLNHECSLHTQRIFTQDWLSYSYPSSASFWLFMGLHKQSDESSWIKIFVFSSSQELYCDFIVVCVFCSHCLFLFSYWFCWFTCDKFGVFVNVAFVNRFMVKQYYTVSIFVTIL